MAGAQFAAMLATRRMNIHRIEYAAEQVNSCGASLNKLLERIKASV